MATDTGSARWPDVERLYHATLDRPPHERVAFLNAASADPKVRSEVEALLYHDAEAGDFLERSAIEDAARTLVGTYGPLPSGQRLGDFEIVELVGAGGMGEVYRARDRRLEREVALKIVHRGDAPADSDVARFEEEARAASGLTHPNVVTIYGVGEQGDLAFIAMEFVHGRTLSRLLDDGRLPMSTALDLAVQIADALAAAHAAGIIHRDLKPDNIMVTADGRIKVLDFGIAKRARADAEEPGIVRGTAGYMSPEQASGGITDHRSDQFSFGAVCYELLTGRRAFQRATLTETIQAVKSVTLEPLHKANPELTPQLRSIVERCLERDPAHRFSSTSDLAAEFRRARDRWLGEEDRRRSLRRAWWLAGAAAAATATAFSAWRFWPSGVRARSIAVLPFTNVDADPAVEYLCDGIAEQLMRRLSFLPDLNVRPRSAAQNFKATEAGVADAARRLQVDAVLAGSIRLSNGRLYVEARLMGRNSAQPLWADHYDQPAGDALAIQEDVARAIVTEGISHPIDAATKRQFDRPFTENADANDRYLRGLHLHRLAGEANYMQARHLLQEAVNLDPLFALAHASLASTFSVMTVDGFERPTESWPAANRAVRRALDLDANLPEAHSEQSSSWFFFDHDWSAAESAWRRATNARPSPTLPDLLGASAVKLWALGRTKDALELARRARALDPISPGFAIGEADLLLQDGQPAAAEAIYRSVLESDPNDVQAWSGLSEACRNQRRMSEALTAFRHVVDLPAPSGGLSDERAMLALERLAAEIELQKLAKKAEKDVYFSPLECARARALLGDRKGTFQDLDAAICEQSPGLVFLKVDRAWHAVRDDPRFADVMTVVGLP